MENIVENNMTETKMGARDLVMKILSDANVKPDELEDGRLGLHFGDADNDEYILVEADNEHRYIRLIDPMWHSVNIWNTEEMARVQSVINKVNTYSRGKIVYSFNDNDEMIISSIITMPLVDSIPGINEYFTSQLSALTDLHQYLMENTDKETVDEKADNEEKGGEA